MIRTKEELKSYFETGDVPTEENFSDLIDTFVTETDLEDKLKDISSFESLTYQSLLDLREESKLKPGQLYRITDYVTTTSQTNTQSAGHQFDVIVLALTNDTLAERAWACHHEGDTYFQNSHLEAWQIWYCLDNDTSRFAWAVSSEEGGRGVIYRMIDEFNNDIPFDFKNIFFSFDGGDNFLQAIYGYSYNNIIKPYCIYNVGFEKVFTQKLNFINITGSDNRLENQCNHIRIVGSNNIFDIHCNNINLLGDDNRANIFGVGCYNMNFNTISQNTFGKSCYSINFSNCEKNEFGPDCYEITLGGGCHRNKFAAVCRRTTLGQGCVDNVFGQECGNNTLGNICSRIVLGANCDFNTFGNYYRYITLDQGVSYCSFVNDETAASGNQVQYYKLTLGIGGSSNSVQNINVSRNNSFETTVSKDSAGNVKQFCIADIASNVEAITITVDE